MPLLVVPTRDRALWQVLKRATVLRVARGEHVDAWHLDTPRCIHIREGVAAVWRGSAVQGVAGGGHLTALEAAFVRRSGEAPRRPGDGGPPTGRGRDGRLLSVVEALTPLEVGVVAGHRALEGIRRGKWTLPLALEALDDAPRRSAAVRRAGGEAAVALASVLREAAGALGTVCADGRVRLPPCIPHRVWAAWSGLHRSTVTTILNDWIFDDRLEQSGRALILPARGGLPGEE